ncbi:unnamed protein product [Calypogeia fissa]
MWWNVDFNTTISHHHKCWFWYGQGLNRMGILSSVIPLLYARGENPSASIAPFYRSRAIELWSNVLLTKLLLGVLL